MVFWPTCSHPLVTGEDGDVLQSMCVEMGEEKNSMEWSFDKCSGRLKGKNADGVCKGLTVVGELLVELHTKHLSLGELGVWTNNGTLGGSFKLTKGVPEGGWACYHLSTNPCLFPPHLCFLIFLQAPQW